MCTRCLKTSLSLGLVTAVVETMKYVSVSTKIFFVIIVERKDNQQISVNKHKIGLKTE